MVPSFSKAFTESQVLEEQYFFFKKRPFLLPHSTSPNAVKQYKTQDYFIEILMNSYNSSYRTTNDVKKCGNHSNKYRIYIDHSKKNFLKKVNCLGEQIIIRDLMQEERLCC